MMHMRRAFLVFVVATGSVACGGSPPPPSTVAPGAVAARTASASPDGNSPPAQTPPTAAGQSISFPNGGSGYVQIPPGPGTHPGLLVIQEFWGLNDWIKQDVARFAERGYAALAVDLYRGKVAADQGEAHELMRGLPED